MIDMLVAGGGPAGLATAILARRAGLDVTVAEPRRGPIDKACGEGLMPPAVARLRALGVEPAGHPLRGIRYLDADHRADAPFRHGQGLGVRRTALHAALAERAAELGIPVLATGVTGFVQRGGLVEAAGLTARYLVAADGLHSTIRQACGLDVAGTGPRALRSRAQAGPLPRPLSRYGLRQHYAASPWTDMVEVYWSATSEAYVTPVADGLVGVAVLGTGTGDFDARLDAFPALRRRLAEAGAEPVGRVRGAGPLRQDVSRRVASRVLLVGDASGYVDALTGEGISVALAQAEALVACVVAGRPGDYEKQWRRVSRKSRLLTAGLLWTRHQPFLASRIVPAAAAWPVVFTGLVNLIAH